MDYCPVANLNGYIVVRYGPKPSPERDLYNCRAAQRQIQNLRVVAEAKGWNLRLVHDYSRTVAGLDGLPVLKKVLENYTKAGSGFLFVECLTTLLQSPQASEREAFLHELQVYGKHVYGVRDRCFLSELSDLQAHARLIAKLPLLRLGDQSLKRDVAAAASSSKRARELHSDAAAALLNGIKTELKSAGQPAGLKDIAKVANDRGYRTQLGTPWSQSSVSRALKRLKGAGQ